MWLSHTVFIPEQSYTNHIPIFLTHTKLYTNLWNLLFLLYSVVRHFLWDIAHVAWIPQQIYHQHCHQYTESMQMKVLCKYPCKITWSSIYNTYKIKYVNCLIMYYILYVYIVGIVGCVHTIYIDFQDTVHECIIVTWCFLKTENIVHRNSMFLFF